MSVVWSKVGDDVLSLAHKIIVEYHSDLLDFNIGFIFRSEAGTAGGKLVLGQASKVSAKLSPVLDMDGIIWIAEDIWYTLPANGKQALLDHELSHFTAPDGQLTLRTHDIEEFTEIIERYGFWNSDLRAAAETMSRASQQLRLPIIKEATGQLIALDPSEIASQVAVASL